MFSVVKYKGRRFLQLFRFPPSSKSSSVKATQLKMPTVTLPSKPDAPVAYELFEGDAASNLLVVFLNGLGLPQTVWKPTIDLFLQSSLSPKPRMITYDRYGQGASPRDPRESSPDKEPGYAHTLDDVTDDLHELIQTLSPDRSSRIVLVNNSIGAHVARRYADR